MATSEKIVSPGVFTNEIDQSFLPAAVGDIGAAVIGPTVKGPAMTPTVVSSISEFNQVFGESFISASSRVTYLTSELARNYLKNGNKLTVVRILDGAFTEATANVPTGSGTYYTGSADIGGLDKNDISFKLHTHNQGEILNNRMSAFDSISGSAEVASGSEAESAYAKIALANDSTIDNLGSGDVISLITTDGITVTCTLGGSGDSTTSAGTDGNVVAKTFAGGTSDDTQGTAQAVEIATAINHNNYFTATNSGSLIEVVQAVPGAAGNTTVTITELGATGMNLSHSFQNGRDTAVGSDGILISGSADNVRWEVTNSNHKKGTFNLLVRAGNDTNRQKQILETWNNLSIDSNAPNYIAKVIGDTKQVLSSPGSEPYIASSGSFPNKSKYVRVEVVKPVTDYLDESGNVGMDGALSSSMPGNGSGSFGGVFTSGSSGWVGFDAFGNVQGSSGENPLFYENISNDNSQGYLLQTANKGKTAYEDAIDLLSNSDEYDINLLFMPGVIDNLANHQAVVTKAINMVDDRGDVFLVVDPTAWGDSPTAAQTRAEAHNSSYTSMYYPWVRSSSPLLGKHVWTPPSVAVSSVYSFNDKVGHPWFAPAGLNRGRIDSAGGIERQLTRGIRDDLYSANVNPIANYPGQGVVVWGQKTLQKKSSALDRVNVRRLLIKLKKFFASTSRFLVFEENTARTRNKFLNIVNPYMEQVQSNSGVEVFKIVMDETNNTPDLVDRNQLVGQVMIHPTRTAEFIVLDFTIQRTGAAFPEQN